MGALLGPLLGSVASGLFGLFGQNSANQQNQSNFETQIGLSNSAYQRASADMKAAGLNPMMMFGSGQPASVPGAPQMQSPTAGFAKSFGDLTSNVLQAQVTSKQLESMTEQIAQLDMNNKFLKYKLDAAESLPPYVRNKVMQYGVGNDQGGTIPAGIAAGGAALHDIGAAAAASGGDKSLTVPDVVPSTAKSVGVATGFLTPDGKISAPDALIPPGATASDIGALFKYWLRSGQKSAVNSVPPQSSAQDVIHWGPPPPPPPGMSRLLKRYGGFAPSTGPEF